jgi:hypothetical protein
MEVVAALGGILGLVGAGYFLLEITRHTKRIADVLEISHEADILGIKAARQATEARRVARATNTNHEVHHG